MLILSPEGLQIRPNAHLLSSYSYCNFVMTIKSSLAYVTTILKSQGSEYPVVVTLLLMIHFVMLQSNLVYTGFTRAKEICIIVVTTKALAYSIHNMVVQKRNMRLNEILTL